MRFRGTILAAALLATAIALVPASRIRLEPDLASLLPEDTPAAADYRSFLETFGGLEKVFVIVEPAEGVRYDAGALGEAAVDLAERLSGDPTVKAARGGISEADQDFFEEQIGPRALLLADGEALARLSDPSYPRERAEAMKRALSGPAGSAAAALLVADPLGIAADRLRDQGAGSSLSIDPSTGAFLSADGGAALVIVTPARAEVDPAGGRALAAAIARAAMETEKASGLSLRVRAVGGPLYAAHDEEAIRRDLMRISGGAVLGVGALLVAAAGGVAIPLAAVLAVSAGIVWTALFAALALGSVTAIGVGFGAILIGMGDDYVNHLGASYREEILRGRSPLRAVAATLRHTAPGIVTSAITTSAAFSAIAFAHFRPLRELGIVVAVGMVLMLAAAFLVGGPAIVLATRGRRRGGSPAKAPAGWRLLGSAVDGCVGLALRRPRATLAAAVLLTLAAAPGLWRLSIDTDPRRLRPEDHPGYDAARTLAERFGVGMETSTAVVRGRDLPEALDRAGSVADRLRAALPREAEVRAPSDWIVAGRRLEERVVALRALPLVATATSFERELAAQGFAEGAFGAMLATMRDLARGDPAEPPPRDSWPDWIAESIREGPEGVAVAVHVRHPDTLAAWRSGPPPALLDELRAEAPGLAFASVPRVGVEMRRVALRDLRRLGALALGVVLLVALVSFGGRVRDAALSVLPVVLGGVWTLGLWGLFGGRLDLFSLAVAPILVGLGDDSGLHVMHRARALPREGLGGATAGSGRAIVLSTITTCAGFGSLLLSEVPALRQGGMLVGLGLFAILAATLFVLPAIEGVRRTAASHPAALEHPHAPQTGIAGRLLGRFHVTGIFWYRLHLGMVRSGPRVVTAPIIFVFTTLFWLALRRIRKAVASNLEVVLGPCGALERERRVFRTFHAFAWCMTERYESHVGKSRFVWDTEGEEHWRALAGTGRGFIMLTAHVGNWELGSMLPVTQERRAVHLVREEELNPQAQRFVSDLLSGVGGLAYVTHFAAHDPQLGMRLLDALRAGEIVALQGDRPRAGGRSVAATMFGRPMPLPAGVPALARAAQAPLLPVFVVREDRCRYRVIFRPPIVVPQAGGRDAAAAEAARRIAEGLEATIRRAPHQWFCFRELWPRENPDQTR